MYFLIPGIVSQVKAFIVDGNIGTAIAAFLGEAVSVEVRSTLPSADIGIVEAIEDRLNYINSVVEFDTLEITDRQLYFIKTARDLVLVETASIKLKARFSTSEFITTEATELEVFGTSNTLDLTAPLEIPARELQPVKAASDIGGVRATELLPGNYVEGNISAAVELISIEVATVPDPLPVGFLGDSEELITTEAGVIEVRSSLAASDPVSFEVITNEVKGIVSDAIYLSTVEIVTEGRIVQTPFGATDLPFIETTSRETQKLDIADSLVAPLEKGSTWLNQAPLTVLNFIEIEPVETELQAIYTAAEFLQDEPGSFVVYEFPKEIVIINSADYCPLDAASLPSPSRSTIATDYCPSEVNQSQPLQVPIVATDYCPSNAYEVHTLEIPTVAIDYCPLDSDSLPELPPTNPANYCPLDSDSLPKIPPTIPANYCPNNSP